MVVNVVYTKYKEVDTGVGILRIFVALLGKSNLQPWDISTPAFEWLERNSLKNNDKGKRWNPRLS